MRVTLILLFLFVNAFADETDEDRDPPEFEKVRRVFNIIIRGPSFQLNYSADHGFKFKPSKSLCKAAAEFAHVTFDENINIGNCHPYQIIFNEELNSRVADVHLVMCPGEGEHACFLRKMKEDEELYKVYILRSLKIGPLKEYEGDGLYYEAGPPSSSKSWD